MLWAELQYWVLTLFILSLPFHCIQKGLSTSEFIDDENMVGTEPPRDRGLDLGSVGKNTTNRNADSYRGDIHGESE